MIQLTGHGVYLTAGGDFVQEPANGLTREEGRQKTLTFQILKKHNKNPGMDQLGLVFDALVSPDNNYVSILQTARASGIKKFPVPYVLSNCHHTLCAVGGTINEDDHVFGMDNVKKYGGIFVPPYRAVLHQYMREKMAGCGKMILGSDSHTRYGALGTLGIGEGGGEVVKQLLGRPYEICYPPVLAVRLTGAPRPGVGPHDVALALAAATFSNGFNKNKILEFVGPGIHSLSMEYRIGIDVMTTETAALSSIWCTDDSTREYLKMHGREEEYIRLEPEEGAYYDGLIEIDLSAVECMIALPYHPSHAMSIREFKERMPQVVEEMEEEGRRIKGDGREPFSIRSHMRNGEFYIDQALVSGCSGGTFENIAAMSDILRGCALPGNGPGLGINPASLPVMADLMNQGIAQELSVCGATLRPAICGPCFGVTDVPANNQLSIRHTTRNYPNREGSKPGQGQMAAVCLMDARSIAATVRNGGRLTAADELDTEYRNWTYHYDPRIYENQVFDNFGKGDPQHPLTMGPNIGDWPAMFPLARHLLLKAVGVYEGSVTTDELIPSGEASSFRSNPEKIAQYTMISRDKDYVKKAKAVRRAEEERRKTGRILEDAELSAIYEELCRREQCSADEIMLGSLMASEQIGDGSSREQAASCQKVLGGLANLANEYSTKRYRSNLINWGILPLLTREKLTIKEGDYLFIRNIRETLENEVNELKLEVLWEKETVTAVLGDLTGEERKILLAGSLINYYKS